MKTARKTGLVGDPKPPVSSGWPRGTGERDTGGAVAAALRQRLEGEVRFDALSRTLYATDASIYEITPRGVVLPKSVEDVVATVNTCREHGVGIVPRGAATGLTGGAVGAGVQLDLARHMRLIGPLNSDAQTIDVQPGVVLDELNAFLEPCGLHFAPDVATSSRATIGGMIANNSCGAHSILFGCTVDHVAEVTVVLGNGEVVTFSDNNDAANDETTERSRQLETGLAEIRDGCFDEIRSRFPRILRSNGGYGLDRLGDRGARAPAVKILCGSEGTLGIVVGAKLRLTPLPKHTGLMVLHYADMLAALAATPALLQHKPAAVELIDRVILAAGRTHPGLARQCDFLHGDPAAVMVVEFFDDDDAAILSRIHALAADENITQTTYAAVSVIEPQRQRHVWELRKAGLGLTMSRPGDTQPYSFVEDTAVDPARLHDYIEQFSAILETEGVEAAYYAHASVGCIHVRPALNLKSVDGVRKLRRIAEAVSSLAVAFGGTMTGEHGDGLVRSEWLEKLYGPTILAAFKKVKSLFDPGNMMNPGKIVDPQPMNHNLRYGPDFAARSAKTLLDFQTHGGMAQLAGMCSGLGQCRQTLVGTMCPSFMATGDETHTTRARANALRVALSNHGLLDGLDDPALGEVMDLCLSCKACKTECPTGVDMARLKAEYLSHRNLKHGVGRRARLIADMPHKLALAGRFPRLANWVAQSRPVRAMLEHRYGLDRRVPPPRLAHQTFRAWFDRHRRSRARTDAPRGTIMYFVDTWTNYFTPQVGKAAVKLLERAGYEVICPRTFCCGRPAISQGLLTEAKRLAEFNVRRLTRFAASGRFIVGTEPSCTLTLVDEYPQLLRSAAARRLADQTLTIESFLQRLLEKEPGALTFDQPRSPLRYHAHCHQKAMIGAHDAVALLERLWGERGTEIDSGCCGMAGAFGHEAEHYEIARVIGEQRLFPAVRQRGLAEIAVSGFSCRHQIEQHTDASPRHLVEHLAELLCETGF